jgi:excisionase family DNA binding protein
MPPAACKRQQVVPRQTTAILGAHCLSFHQSGLSHGGSIERPTRTVHRTDVRYAAAHAIVQAGGGPGRTSAGARSDAGPIQVGSRRVDPNRRANGLGRSAGVSIAGQDVARRWVKMTEDADVLTTEEAADLLRVSTKTILALAREGALPGEKIGRAWRFLRADLLEHLHGRHRHQEQAATL